MEKRTGKASSIKAAGVKKGRTNAQRKGRTGDAAAAAATAAAADAGAAGAEGEVPAWCDPTKEMGAWLNFAAIRKICGERGFTDFGPYGGVPSEEGADAAAAGAADEAASAE